MGQLDVYSLIDTFLIIVSGGYLTGYFSEEVGATAEQVSPASYSGNFILNSCTKFGSPRLEIGSNAATTAFSSNKGFSCHRKVKKLLKTFFPVQDSREAVHSTWVLLDFGDFRKFDVHRSINEKMIWLDLEIIGYGKQANEVGAKKLGLKHN